jgi:hypothetical protein
MYSLFGGVISGLIAALIFFIATRRMRPKISISPYVSVYPDQAGNEILRLKIVNMKRRAVSNICVEMFVEHKEPALNGEVKVRDPLGDKFVSTMLPPRKRRDTVFDNALRIRIDRKDLLGMLAKYPDGYLTVHVYAQDAISGVGGIFSTNYAPGIDLFTYGAFEFGNGTSITPYAGTYPYRLPSDLDKAKA